MMLGSQFRDEGFGYDLFGMHPIGVERALRIGLPLYHRYFHVTSHGNSNIPANGGAILVANHGGILPIDAAMLWIDVLRWTARILRPIADRFLPLLPFANTLLARAGVVSGTRANVRRLLEQGELLAIFPEGVSGPAKPYRDRYLLQQWRGGHVELAIRHQVPIVPAAIVGAEECWPLLARMPVRLFGVPYLPIPWTLLPVPGRIAIHYGAPIDLHRRYQPDDADDPAVLANAAQETHDAVEHLIARGLAERAGS